MICLKKADTEDVVWSINDFAQKLYMVAAVIFTLIDVKGESASKQ